MINYIRLQVLKLKQRSSYLYLSEVCFFDDAGEKIPVSSLTATINGQTPSVSSLYAPEMLIDGNNSTYARFYNWGGEKYGECTIIFALERPVSALGSYYLVTSGAAPDGDPAAWRISVSEDGESFTSGTVISNAEITDERTTATELFLYKEDGAMRIIPAQNDGYPFFDELKEVSGFSHKSPQPEFIMRCFGEDINEGYPCIMKLEGIERVADSEIYFGNQKVTEMHLGGRYVSAAYCNEQQVFRTYYAKKQRNS